MLTFYIASTSLLRLCFVSAQQNLECSTEYTTTRSRASDEHEVQATTPNLCIEVKGTTTGQVKLSENQHRAARRFRASYYLYVVSDPLGEHPALTIIRDPWAKMAHDDILYSGARYVYNASTWRAAADEETPL